MDGCTIRPVRSQNIVYINGIHLNNTTLCLESGRWGRITATIYPDNASYRDVIWESSNEAIASVDNNGIVTAGAKSGICTITCRAADGGDAYAECQVTSIKLCPDDQHIHAIDLGLPSGTKWCCCNYHSKVTSPGHRYAWGELDPKWWSDSEGNSEPNYELYNYKYYDSETRKYIDIGGDIAGTSYDVATVRLGEPWRMPTLEQMKELIDNCTLQEAYYSVGHGFVVTGPNGNQIFLPHQGTHSYYWTSTRESLTFGDAYALDIVLENDEYSYWHVLRYYLTDIDMWEGCYVRPVCQ